MALRPLYSEMLVFKVEEKTVWNSQIKPLGVKTKTNTDVSLDSVLLFSYLIAAYEQALLRGRGWLVPRLA